MLKCFFCLFRVKIQEQRMININISYTLKKNHSHFYPYEHNLRHFLMTRNKRERKPKILGKRNYNASVSFVSHVVSVGGVKTTNSRAPFVTSRSRITSRRLHRGGKESGTVVLHAGE